MGNISSMARASTALDSYVAELGNDISYDKRWVAGDAEQCGVPR